MKKVFIDAKYSSSNPEFKEPISVAFVELESGESKYFEFSDFFEGSCDENALTNIIPNLKQPLSERVTIISGMQQVSQWIESLGECSIIGESIDDYDTIMKYMKIPSNLAFFAWISQIIALELDISKEDTLNSAVEHFNKIKTTYFEYNNKTTHNALDDAQAIYHAYNSLVTDPLLKRIFKNN